jgi:acetylornithine deacetylase/succinyl-diaminopimelate desuccinylase-like protein
MASLETRAIRADRASAAGGSQEAMRRVAAASPAWNATLRTTCVATQLEGGHAVNALPQLAAATVNCRVLPDESEESVRSTLQKVFADGQVTLTVMGTVTKGPASAMRPDVMQAISGLTEKLWPGVRAVPIMVMGATDGAYLRAAGIPTYGVQGFFFDRDDIRFHGRDERMGVETFYEGQAFLYDLVRTLAKSAQ